VPSSAASQVFVEGATQATYKVPHHRLASSSTTKGGAAISVIAQ